MGSTNAFKRMWDFLSDLMRVYLLTAAIGLVTQITVKRPGLRAHLLRSLGCSDADRRPSDRCVVWH